MNGGCLRLALLGGAVLVLIVVLTMWVGTENLEFPLIMGAFAFISALPVALLPRRKALWAAAIVGGVCLLLVVQAYLAVISDSNDGSDGQWKIGAAVFGIAMLPVLALNAGMALLRLIAKR